MSKALLIKSYTQLTTGAQGVWNDLSMASSYIQGIETGRILDGMTADKLGALISGVPTPWARAKLFRFALHTLATPDPNINQKGLAQYYGMLANEWKGLIAVIALFPDRIKFSNPVSMDIRGGDYEISSAFGRMLFDDNDLWCNQDELSKNPDTQPFIQLIYYRGHLIGGTSPLTGLFAGIQYDLSKDASDVNWYRGGHFVDPTSYLSSAQLQKLYLFIKNLNLNIESFESKINSCRNGKNLLDLRGMKTIARDWEKELLIKGQGRLKDKGPIAKYDNLSCPFSVLFHSDVPVYLKPDYSFTYSGNVNYELVGDIQQLLSNDKSVVGWNEPSDVLHKLSSAPVYFLRVQDIQAKQDYYFTIPLSEKGLDIFKNSFSRLLGDDNSSNTHLIGHITDSGQLAVSLTVEIDGESVNLNTKEYDIDWLTDPGRVILWPNFISPHWNKYYLFTEFTSDAKEQFMPFFVKKEDDGKNVKYESFIKTKKGNLFTQQDELDLLRDEDRVQLDELIRYPTGSVDGLPKYNIIRSDIPIAGLKVIVKEKGKDTGAGFLLIKNGKGEVEEITNNGYPSDARVGIDFGSNNTCVYFINTANGRTAEPMKFDNLRAVLVGKENNNTKAIAENNELLFFSNYPSDNGQLKSWLHEHDSRYNSSSRNDEISGGVPVYRPNVLVEEMDRYEITTQAGKLHYNMKWLDNESGRQKKQAFLKTIWLQSCAYLFKNRIRPTEIAWSYPGSMMESDVNNLSWIFEQMCKMTPINNVGPGYPKLSSNFTTEAESVCSYALGRDFGLNSNNMFLGIDIGGSTSDILLLAKDPTNNNSSTLYRESSVRLAAGVFFDAVIKSDSFRKALYTFHEGEGKRLNIFIENIKEILSHKEKAPYFLNCIFDQLKRQDEYEKFYTSIYGNGAKFVFTIPAYVTGLLLYYSGMLIGHTIKDQNLTQITRIDILPFGKGGRLFHWLLSTVGDRATEQYYKNCLDMGVNKIIGRSLEVKYRNEISVDNKAEVAIGLCDPKQIIKKRQTNDSDICGESGVKFRLPDGSYRELLNTDELTGNYFDNSMNNFDFTSVHDFNDFIEIFITFVSQKTDLCPQAREFLCDDLKDLPNRISSYVCNDDTEYRKACSNASSRTDGFHYHQPIIIAEGTCFLIKTLIPKLFNQ